MKNCLFCDWKNKDRHHLVTQSENFYARYDNFPVSPGHCEIVPKKHTDSFFKLNSSQLAEFYLLLKKTQKIIAKKFHPTGYNLGINEGEAAGRTIHHLHFHLIPRYRGDVKNPRGGIRNIMPGKGNY
jgi:diadenosine tetraphosphate (Ap4A) HIT family hydrolase